MIPDPASRLYARLMKPELGLGLSLALGIGPRPQPGFALNFLSGPPLNSAITYTRASTATVTNASGVIEVVASGTARFDYNPVTLAPLGLLIEESRTNLLLNSLVDGTNLSTQTATVTAAAHTLSFYGTGTVTLTGAYVGSLAGSGAYPARSTLTFTPTAGPLLLTVTGTVQFAQLELGAFATSFIPTAGATVTRAADVALISGTAFSSWFNPTAGTLVADFIPKDATGTSQIFAFSAGANTNRIGANAAAGLVTYQVVSGGASQVAVNPGTFVAGSPSRLAIAYAVNDFGASLNGGAPVVDTLGTLPTVDRLGIGANATAAGFLNGHMRSLAYYNRRLTNAELQLLSA